MLTLPLSTAILSLVLTLRVWIKFNRHYRSERTIPDMVAALEIKNLHVSVEDKPILRGVNLTVKQGEVHALMGPNGSGKSTLANVLLGNPAYEVTAGEIIFDGHDLLEMEADERSRAGLFLAFQYPVSIPGVTLANFLRLAINARMKAVDPELSLIHISEPTRH